jgi:tetratricopeptide (TPR) repeat protein
MMPTHLSNPSQPASLRGEHVPLVSGSLLSHYEIRSKIGAGGMGEVYLAHDTRLGRDVALKILPDNLAQDPHRMQRFIQEARAASAINHPNVCIIHEVGQSDDGRSFIAMEYIEGETLASKIQGGPLPSFEIVDLGIQVASALEGAHAKGIIHRDIKPRNIAVTPRGQAKVLDFGLAHVMPQQSHVAIEEASTLARTDTGILLGTIDYMSPEQALGREIDTRTDIFSLGVVLYEMATGRKPFSTENKLETIDRIAHAEPDPPSQLNKRIPSELQRIITKCLEKSPQQRYQSARALVSDLQALKHEAHPRLYRKLTAALAVVSLVLLLLWIPPVRQQVQRWSGLARLPEKKFLAVLPFRVIGDDVPSQTFADGLMEILPSRLSLLEQFHGALSVVPAVEVRERGITSVNKAQAAFGVTLVVSGSVQRLDARVRLTLNLNDAKTLKQLWSSVDDYALNNALALQDGVVLKLANMLELEMRPEMEQLLAKRRTTVPAAYDFYTQARVYLSRFENVKNIDAAIGLFEQSTQQDPNYTLAFAGLGEAYWRKFEATHDTQWVPKAVEKCQQAREHGGDLPEVEITLGLISTGTGKNQEAIEHFERALDLDPMSSEAYRGMARAYEALGDKENLDKAEATYLKGIQLKPSYWAGYSNLGRFYYRVGRFEDSLQQFKQVVVLTPDNEQGYASLGAIYYHLERWEEARDAYEQSISIRPNQAALRNLGVLYYSEEHYAEAAQAFEKALDLSGKDYRLVGNVGAAYYWMPGMREKGRLKFREAAQMAEERRKLNPKDITILSDLAGYYGVLGERTAALSLILQLAASVPADVHVTHEIAQTYEQLGDRTQAIHWLGKALKQGYSVRDVEQNPWLKDLRTDERFRRLLQDIPAR